VLCSALKLITAKRSTYKFENRKGVYSTSNKYFRASLYSSNVATFTKCSSCHLLFFIHSRPNFHGFSQLKAASSTNRTYRTNKFAFHGALHPHSFLHSLLTIGKSKSTLEWPFVQYGERGHSFSENSLVPSWQVSPVR